MERYIKPDRLELDTSDPDSNDQWLHWRDMFEGFLSELQSSSTSALTGSQKLTLLLHHISSPIYKCLSGCQNFFAIYLLATQRQETEETLELYLQNLKILSRDCDFTALTASQAKDIAIRDAFISGVQSNQTRQRMLVNKDLDLATAYELALTLDMAQKQSDLYSQPDFSGVTIPAQPHSQQIPISNSQHCDPQDKDSSNTIEQPVTIVNTLVHLAQPETVDVIDVASRDIF